MWESTAVKEGVRERVTTDGLREDALEPGRVGFRLGGCCCRIRWRPERPSPCSWSVVIKEEVLEVEKRAGQPSWRERCIGERQTSGRRNQPGEGIMVDGGS